MFNNIVQFGITLFGGLSILLVARNNKWGFIHGFISQIFFIISSLIDKQIGVFVLSVVEIFIWSYGIYKWFFRKNKKTIEI